MRPLPQRAEPILKRLVASGAEAVAVQHRHHLEDLAAAFGGNGDQLPQPGQHPLLHRLEAAIGVHQQGRHGKGRLLLGQGEHRRGLGDQLLPAAGLKLPQQAIEHRRHHGIPEVVVGRAHLQQLAQHGGLVTIEHAIAGHRGKTDGGEGFAGVHAR